MQAQVLLHRAVVGQADEIVIEHAGKVDDTILPQGAVMHAVRRRDHHQPVGAEQKRLQAAHVHRIGDDAHVGQPFRDGLDDIVTETLFQVDGQVRMAVEKSAERLGQEFAERRRIAQQPQLPFQAARKFAQFSAHFLHLH